MRMVNYTGDALKSLRSEFKLTQVDAANFLGVSQGLISQLESEMVEPGRWQLQRLGRMFSTLAGYKIAFYFDHDWIDPKSQV